MIETYGFFDSLENDERVYAEADFARFAQALGWDGVRGGESALKVQAAALGLGVTVNPGAALVDGRYYALVDDGSGEKTLSLAAAQNNPRVDRIVLCLDYGARTVQVCVLQGEEAAVPAAPSLQRDTERYMLSLCRVRVAVGAGSLAAEDVTDERADEAVCGLHVVSADAALTAAKAAQAAAQSAQAEAERRALSVNGKTPDAAGNVSLKIGVQGAQAGHVAVFDAQGDLQTGGVALSSLLRATMTMEGGVLTITTQSGV